MVKDEQTDGKLQSTCKKAVNMYAYSQRNKVKDERQPMIFMKSLHNSQLSDKC